MTDDLNQCLHEIKAKLSAISTKVDNMKEKYDEDHLQLKNMSDKIHNIELYQRDSTISLEDKINVRLTKIEESISKLKISVAQNSVIVSIVTTIFVSIVVAYVKSMN
jgi:DNA repair ATPase RecN